LTTYTAPIRTKENILVVDDVRVMTFEATYARTISEAEALIESQPWDEVWLDHDLDFNFDTQEEAMSAWQSMDTSTTRPVVRWLERRAAEGRPLDVSMFIVHTANPVGKKWIASALLPWYNVAVTSAEDWTVHAQLPRWMSDLGDD
jgi:hypothetical protein